ncbi:MAG: endonuclease III [Bacteriovoracaceae bacterium]
MNAKEKAPHIFMALHKEFPNAHCELIHKNAFELLIATVLSAQTTDVNVNKATPALFKAYPDAKALSQAPIEKVEVLVHSTGFYKTKAKNIVSAATQIMELYQGEIPKTIEELTLLSGVGRKTANVVLGNAFNINYGVVVDTHVKRISSLLGLSKHDDVLKIEQDLMKLFDREQWTLLSHLFIFLGRRICIARRPQCEICPLQEYCSFKLKKTKAPKSKKAK